MTAPPISSTANAEAPAIWICFADNGNIRAWTRDHNRKELFRLQGLDMQPFYQSLAKATEGKAGMAEGQALVRRSTAGTGLRVGAADAVQPATSEIMDVTAGETAPLSSSSEHDLAIQIERLIFKHVKVREIFDGALEFVGTSAAADAILDELNSRAQQTQWQPIETAPRDGTAILIFDPKAGWAGNPRDSYMPRDALGANELSYYGDDPRLLWYDDHRFAIGYWRPWPGGGWGNRNSSKVTPTHWMPLPEGPSLPSTEGQSQ